MHHLSDAKAQPYRASCTAATHTVRRLMCFCVFRAMVLTSVYVRLGLACLLIFVLRASLSSPTVFGGVRCVWAAPCTPSGGSSSARSGTSAPWRRGRRRGFARTSPRTRSSITLVRVHKVSTDSVVTSVSLLVCAFVGKRLLIFNSRCGYNQVLSAFRHTVWLRACAFGYEHVFLVTSMCYLATSM